MLYVQVVLAHVGQVVEMVVYSQVGAGDTRNVPTHVIIAPVAPMDFGIVDLMDEHTC
jgi:hypothetical protein